jgi:hypothetical protein
MFLDLQDRLHRFAERKITRLDDQGQIITDENGAQGDPDDSNAERSHVRLVKGGSVDSKKGMFHIEPQQKIEMLKK